MAERMSFEAYVTARGPSLLRFAAVLTGDPHGAQDLVQTALLKASGRWRRVSRLDHPDAYVRKVVVNTHLSASRRLWRGEVPTAALPEPPTADVLGGVDDRDQVRRLLAGLGPRQRAVLVLRYYADLDDAAIADQLGVSPSTVRSQAARALASLRATTTEESR